MASDDLDGALAPRAKEALSLHFASCPACRAYRESLLKLQAGALDLNSAAERPDADWADFGARLEARIDAERPPVLSQTQRPARRVWLWSGAGLAAAGTLAAYLLVLRPADVRPGPFVFSFEETVASILDEIGDDAELERSFAGALQASIEDAVGASEAAYGAPSDNPLFWEGLSDDDLSRIESGLQKEKKS
jgi:hypothetical protein